MRGDGTSQATAGFWITDKTDFVADGNDSMFVIGINPSTESGSINDKQFLVGNNSTVVGLFGLTVGNNTIGGDQTTKIGSEGTGTGVRGVAVGALISLTHNEAMVFGKSGASFADNGLGFGSGSEPISELRFNEGETTGSDVIIRSAGSTGGSRAATKVSIFGGKWTGGGSQRASVDIGYQDGSVVDHKTLSVGIPSSVANTGQNVIHLENAVIAPTVAIANGVTIASYDVSAGNTSLQLMLEGSGAITSEAVISDTTLIVTINGTAYKILMDVV